MKKLIVMLLMMVASAFASQLFALDTIKIGCDVEKSKTLSELDGVVDIPSDLIFVKVNILHKDTLMYSWGEGLDNKKIMRMSGYKQNINLVSTAVAVVCYPRGVIGA